VSVARGDVVLVRLGTTEGAEIRKTRPAVVLSNPAACRADAVVQVVPITALPNRALRPYEARIDSDAAGVSKPSRAVANQLRTVSRSRLQRVLGSVSCAELEAVERAVLIQLGIQRAV
jgi:mRNA interferase MazF